MMCLKLTVYSAKSVVNARTFLDFFDDVQNMFERLENDELLKKLCSGLRIEATIVGNGIPNLETGGLDKVDGVTTFKERILFMFRSIAGSRNELKDAIGEDFQIYLLGYKQIAKNFKAGLERAKELGRFTGRNSDTVNPLTKSTIHCLLQSIGYVNPRLAVFDPRWPRNADHEFKPFDESVIASASAEASARAADRAPKKKSEVLWEGMYIDLDIKSGEEKHFSNEKLAKLLKKIAVKQKGPTKFCVKGKNGAPLTGASELNMFSTQIQKKRDLLIGKQSRRVGYFPGFFRKLSVASEVDLEIIKMINGWMVTYGKEIPE